MAESKANPTTMYERHFTPRTLAELWGFSEDTVREWFEDVPGVLRQGDTHPRGRQRRVTIRIPESVAKAVYEQRTKTR